MTHTQSLYKLDEIEVLLGGNSTFPGEYDFPRSLALRPGTRAASSLLPCPRRQDGAVTGSVVG